MTKYLLLAAFVAACSSPSSNSQNTDVCASQADCPPSEFCNTQHECSTKCDDGSTECGSGACVAGACVECAADTDCTDASTPACDTTTNTCVQCVSAGDCAASTPVCITATNTCVECTGDAECSGATPVCNTTTNTCGACGSDSQCASNICTSSGACAEPSTIVYLDAGGTDTGGCGSAAPCRTLSYAVTQASSTRDVISMGSGAYNDTFVIDSATALDIHGHGAGITSTTQGSAFEFDSTVTIRDVTFDGGSGAIATLVLGSADYILDDVTVIHGAAAIESSGGVTATGLTIHDAGYAVQLGGGSLTVDRALIHNSAYGIYATAASTLQLTNAMMYGFTTGLAIDLTHVTNAMISFSTIVSAIAASPATVNCPGGVGTISASIIWALGSTQVPVTGCNLENSSFVGPTAVAGASNTDPGFVNETGSDYDLGSGSPAIDLLQSGPSDDYKADKRPSGNGYDVGADEYQKP